MKRPHVNIRCVADRLHADGQRIIEFTFPCGAGGLITLHTSPTGVPCVAVYRADEPVQVAFTAGSGYGLDQVPGTRSSVVFVQKKRGGSDGQR